MAVMEQIGRRPITGTPKARRWTKRRSAKARRRQSKKLMENAPQRTQYTGYYD